MEALEADQARLFKRFVSGGILLIGSLVSVFMLNMYLPPSHTQEIYALIALVLAALGGLLALTSYLGLIWIRIKLFLERK